MPPNSTSSIAVGMLGWHRHALGGQGATDPVPGRVGVRLRRRYVAPPPPGNRPRLAAARGWIPAGGQRLGRCRRRDRRRPGRRRATRPRPDTPRPWAAPRCDGRPACWPPQRAATTSAAVLVILDERRQPAPGLGQLTHQRIAACGIAVDLLQDGGRPRGVVVGAQRQLRRDNVVQPGQNRRPVRLDELAAVGQGSAGLLDSSGVEQHIRSDDGRSQCRRKSPHVLSLSYPCSASAVCPAARRAPMRPVSMAIRVHGDGRSSVSSRSRPRK